MSPTSISSGGAGDYVAENLAGWPIFVRRNDDRASPASTTCAPTAPDRSCGTARVTKANMVCRYHGWAFRNDGSLLNAAGFRMSDTRWHGPDPDPGGLVGAGMVFVCLDPNVPPLHEWLGAFPMRSPMSDSKSFPFHSRTVRNVACNWKTYGDNFMEGYHLPTVHPAMSRDADALNYKVISRAIGAGTSTRCRRATSRRSACSAGSGRRSRSTCSPAGSQWSGGCRVGTVTPI